MWPTTDCEISEHQLFYVITPSRVHGECVSYEESFIPLNGQQGGLAGKSYCFMTRDQHEDFNLNLETDVSDIKRMDSEEGIEAAVLRAENRKDNVKRRRKGGEEDFSGSEGESD